MEDWQFYVKLFETLHNDLHDVALSFLYIIKFYDIFMVFILLENMWNSFT